MKREDKDRWKKRDARVEDFLRKVLDDDRVTSREDTAYLVHTIRWASQSADRLSTRVFWLNVILVVLGTLALIVAAVGVFRG